jgi:surface antigen
VTATAQAVLNVARGQLGFLEGLDNHNPYGPFFGWPDHQAYCDEFVSWVAAHAGATGIVGKSANCAAHVAWFKARGQFGHTPRVGAVVFFDWNGDGIADHVGYVNQVLDAGRVQTIEGNTRDPQSTAPGARQGVFKVNRSTVSVLGYGYPAYGEPSRPPVPLPRPAPHTAHVVPLVVDGSWGPKTEQHLETYLRISRPDGALDAVTVRAIQRWVGVRQDGDFGPITRKALQHCLGVTQDGAIGKVTIKALQRYLNRNI